MADAVVLLESPERIPGGKFVEAGIAIGQGKIVFNIGRRENMLMWHPQVWQCDKEWMQLQNLVGGLMIRWLTSGRP